MAVVNGTSGSEILEGTKFEDTIFGYAGADTLLGFDSNDTIYGREAHEGYVDDDVDHIEAGGGNDRIYAGRGDLVDGGLGDDLVILRGAPAVRPTLTFEGGEGFDTLKIEANFATPRTMITLDDGAHSLADITLNRVERLETGRGAANVFGGSNNDQIFVSGNDDVVWGDLGDDTVGVYGLGKATLDGEGGQDTLSFEMISLQSGALASGGTLVKLHQSGPQNYYWEAYTPDYWPQPNIPPPIYYRTAGQLSVTSFEHFIGSAYRDAVEGSDGGNRLDGRGGSDELLGLGGTDTLLGGQGADTLDGGAGQDELYGQADNDSLSGGDDADRLFGEAGQDKLNGGEGADSLDGGAGQDTLHGGEGADTLHGGVDSDRLYGEGGADLLISEGNYNYQETLSGGAGDDTLVGGFGGGTLMGGAGADRIEGSFISGDRSYVTASYADATSGIVMDRRLDSSNWTGDAKGDTLVNIHQIELSSFGDAFYGRGASSTDGPAFNDDVRAGAGADTVFGFGGADNVWGDDGNDSLSGGEGMDDLMGGAGADWLDAGAGRDHLYGGLGDDTVLGGGDGDWIYEKAFGDAAGGSGNDSVDGGAGDDYITHDNGDDTIHGGEGNDTIYGSVDGQQRFVGGWGDDAYHVQRADTLVVEEDFGGLDTVILDAAWNVGSYQLVGHVENLDATAQGQKVALTGNIHDNRIVGSRHNDTIMGGGGDDVLKGGAGDDLLDGGDNGIFSTVGDTVEFDGKLADYSFETLANGDLKVTDLRANPLKPDGVDTLRNVERLKFSDVERARSDLANKPPSPQPDTIEVDEDAVTGNLYQLLLGNDTDPDGDQLVIHDIGRVGTLGTVAFSGPEALTYAADADVFDQLKEGETATDTFTYSVRDKTGAIRETTVTVTIKGRQDAQDWQDLTNGADHRQFGDGVDKVRGLGGADSLHGGYGEDVLDGGADNDTLDGGASADVLIGGQGDDRIIGGLGDKSLTGGEGADLGIFDFSGASADISLRLTENLNHTIDVLGTQISGFERVEFRGGSGNDYLSGDTLADDLFGNGGNDTLSGGGGADRMFGGAGDDTYFVNNLGQILTETTGIDTVQTTLASYGLAAAFENLEAVGGGNRQFLGNQFANKITGGAGNDTLDGGLGNDTLVGGDGADRLLGGKGVDTLIGGTGKDRFVFDSLEGDAISDWQAGDVIDVLALEAYGLRLTMRSDHTRAEFDLDGDGQFDDGLLIVQGTSVKLADFDW